MEWINKTHKTKRTHRMKTAVILKMRKTQTLKPKAKMKVKTKTHKTEKITLKATNLQKLRLENRGILITNPTVFLPYTPNCKEKTRRLLAAFFAF